MEKIILYSTNCPKCKILESKLNAAGINYETCSDTELMIKKGFRSVPVLEVNDKLMIFTEAITWIKER